MLIFLNHGSASVILIVNKHMHFIIAAQLSIDFTQLCLVSHEYVTEPPLVVFDTSDHFSVLPS